MVPKWSLIDCFSKRKKKSGLVRENFARFVVHMHRDCRIFICVCSFFQGPKKSCVFESLAA